MNLIWKAKLQLELNLQRGHLIFQGKELKHKYGTQRDKSDFVQ